jgi:hypothetical protein
VVRVGNLLELPQAHVRGPHDSLQVQHHLLLDPIVGNSLQVSACGLPICHMPFGQLCQDAEHALMHLRRQLVFTRRAPGFLLPEALIPDHDVQVGLIEDLGELLDGVLA